MTGLTPLVVRSVVTGPDSVHVFTAHRDQALL